MFLAAHMQQWLFKEVTNGSLTVNKEIELEVSITWDLLESLIWCLLAKKATHGRRPFSMERAVALTYIVGWISDWGVKYITFPTQIGCLPFVASR